MKFNPRRTNMSQVMRSPIKGFVLAVRCLSAFLFCICINLEAQAASIVLSTCAQTDVIGAINSASNGDTIVCPAGSWSWSNVDITKNITLKGAGIGITNISITSNAGLESPASYTGAFRVTGFTFISTGNFGDFDGATLYIRNGNGWRVDHNEFQIYSNSSSGSGGNGMHIKGDASGLIDHNRFVNGGGGSCMHACIQVSNSGTTSTNENAMNYSWLNFNSNNVLGSADHTVFVEDNYFRNTITCASHNPHTIYGRHGGVVVFRHNEIHGLNADNHPFIYTHAGFAFEISNNTWGNAGTSLYTLIDIAGGTGVIYNNTRTGNANYGIMLDFVRSTSSTGGSVTSFVPGYGTVSSSSSCSSTEGYPCAEQPGRGQNNSSDPIYIWGNTSFPSMLLGSTTYIQQGRDYFLNSGQKPGYTSYPYPHPLTSDTSLPPSPPKNLRVLP